MVIYYLTITKVYFVIVNDGIPDVYFDRLAFFAGNSAQIPLTLELEKHVMDVSLTQIGRIPDTFFAGPAENHGKSRNGHRIHRMPGFRGFMTTPR